MLEDFLDQYASGYRYAKHDDGWCYEDGCVYRGLLKLYRATDDRRWFDHLERLVSPQVAEDGALLGYAQDEYNIDNIMAGRALFALTEARSDRFDKALDLLAGQLQHHPRTAQGSYWHKKIYPYQVWLDGLYMGLPFQIEYGLLRSRTNLVDDAAAQLLRATNLMRDSRTGFYFHGIDTSRAESWSDPQTGLSSGLWGRANGWLAMALIDSFALLPPDHPARPEIRRRALALADAILGHRTANGLWLQVLDQPELTGNYEETSCSAMFAYFLLKAARLFGEISYADDGMAAVDALEKHCVHNQNGIWRLENVCEVAGLGGFFGKPRNGTPDYYISEPVVANDPKGVGPLMMAVAERECADSSAHLDASAKKASPNS